MASHPYETLWVDREFDNLKDDAFLKITDAIAAKGHSYKVRTSNSSVWEIICRGRTQYKCNFTIRVRGNEFGARLVTLKPHTCPAICHDSWEILNSTKYITAHQRANIKADTKVKPKTIQTNERVGFGNQIPYKAAWRARQAVKQEVEGNIKEQFKIFMPWVLDMSHASSGKRITDSDEMFEIIHRGDLLQYDGAVVFHVEKENEDGDIEVHGVFIAPHACVNAFKYSRPILFLDGGHMYSEEGGVLLMATTLDPDEEILPLAFAIVTTEAKKTWTWFLNCFHSTFFAQSGNLTVISDRAKGLHESIEKTKPENLDIWHYYCTQHLRENVERQFGKEIGALFMKACLVKTISEFDTTLDTIQAKEPGAAEYIRNIPADHYAYAHSPLTDFPRFFHTTSNIAESSNNLWKPARQMTWLLAVDHIWHSIMKQFYDRREKKHFTQDLTRFYDKYWEMERESSGFYLVQPQSRSSGTALVKRGESSHGGRLVNLRLHTCTCLEWQDRRFPCRHAIAVMHYFKDREQLQRDPCRRFFTVETYKKMYEGSLRPSPWTSIAPEEGWIPPPKPKKKGRPKEKRYRRQTLHSQVRKESRKLSDAQKREQAKARRGATSTSTTQSQLRVQGGQLSGIQRERLQQRLEHSSDEDRGKLPATTMLSKANPVIGTDDDLESDSDSGTDFPWELHDNPLDDFDVNSEANDTTLETSSWNGFSDPPAMEDPIVKELLEIDNEITRVFDQNRKLDAAMERRKQQERQQEQQLSHDRFSTPQPHQKGSSPKLPTTPLSIRAKMNPKRTRDAATEVSNCEHEGTPSKRVNIVESSEEEREPSSRSLEALEAALSRNDKAQGISTGNIMHQKRRRG